MYQSFLQGCFPSATVTIVEESETRSRYTVEEGGPGGGGGVHRRAGVSFLVEGERAHLPVALASMIAKLVRELAMQRFNRSWCEIARARANIELKPTAGYATDAGRWLQDAREVLTRAEREAVVRIC
jgi:ribonuclease HII